MGRKLTYEQVKKMIEDETNFEYELLSDVYVSSKDYLKIRHKGCGHEFMMTLNNFGNGNRCPAKECVKKRTAETNLIKYGGPAPACSKEVQDKMKASTREKYGVDNIFERNDIIQESFEKLYGVKNPQQVKEIRERTAQTNLELYGHTCALHGEEGERKTKETLLRNYGVDHNFKIPGMNEKKRQNWIERYGVAHPKQAHFPDWLKPATYDDEALLTLVKDIPDYATLIKRFPDHYYEINAMLSRLGKEFHVKGINSVGELRIKEFLTTHNVYFQQQIWFDDCRSKLPLPFDFGIYKDAAHTKLLFIIEFDGIQHYKPVKHFGGESAFKDTQYWDNYKTQYCVDHNIPLLRIPYWDYYDLETIIMRWLSKYRYFRKPKQQSNS